MTESILNLLYIFSGIHVLSTNQIQVHAIFFIGMGVMQLKVEKSGKWGFPHQAERRNGE
jgi:hypothetical protein